MQGKTYLITGGSGFLGCHVAEELLKRGAHVRTLDIAELEEPGLVGHVDAVLGDVRDEMKVEKALEGVDVVVHCAAALPLEKPPEVLSTNVGGTKMILQKVQEQGKARVVHISSTAVYGIPKKHPIEETDPQHGVGAYGVSKVQAEAMIQSFRGQGMVIPVIRPKTFIGTGRLGVFQILFDWVQKGARIPIIGSGKNRYQLLEVKDLVEAILLAAEGDESSVNAAFNVGAKKFDTVREDIQALCDVAGSGSKVLATPAMPVKAVLRVLEAMRLSPLYKWVYGTADKDSFVSTEKIEQQLGWQPKHSNADTLKNTYKWYEEAYEDYQGAVGTTHKVAWDQGALALVRRMLGGR